MGARPIRFVISSSFHEAAALAERLARRAVDYRRRGGRNLLRLRRHLGPYA